jgi:hypothetical protein
MVDLEKLYMPELRLLENQEASKVIVRPRAKVEIYALRFLPSPDLRHFKLTRMACALVEQIRKPVPCHGLAGLPSQQLMVPFGVLDPAHELWIEVSKPRRTPVGPIHPFLLVRTIERGPWQFD